MPPEHFLGSRADVYKGDILHNIRSSSSDNHLFKLKIRISSLLFSPSSSPINEAVPK